MTVPPPLSVDAHDDGESVRLQVVGELDLATVPAFEAALEAQRPHRRDLVLDLTGLEFVDSTGQRAIVDAVKAAQDDGRRVSIRGLTQLVERGFTVTGLLAQLPLE